jgi:hypothetical protein
MGMRPEEFWDMTIFEWNCKYTGYLRKRNHQDDQLAFLFRETWAYVLHAGGYRGEDEEPIKGEDLLRLPSEKKRKRDTPRSLNPLLSMSDEQRNDLRERINRAAPNLD